MPLDTLLALLSVIGVSALSASLGALAVIAWRPAPKVGQVTVIMHTKPEAKDLAFEHFRFTEAPYLGERTIKFTEPASAEAMGAIPPQED